MSNTAWATASTRTVAAIIQQTPIRRDQEGRYCLNDLHRAAGGEKRHSPNYFINLDSTKELAEAVANTGNPVINPIDLSRGRYGGTYVHEDLAIDYAAWISPVFKLEVYRAFKETRKEKETDLVTVVAPAGTSLSALLLMASEAVAEKERLEAQIAADQPKVGYADATMADERTTTIREAAKQFGMSDQRLTKFLIEKRVLFRQGKSVLPYQRYVDDGRFVIKGHTVSAAYVHRYPHITGKGLVFIHRLLSKIN